MITTILIRAGDFLFQFIVLLIIVNIIFSWVRPDPNNVFVRTIYNLTEPILTPLRRFTVFGQLDLSAFAAILLLQFIIFPLYKMIILAVF
jgi:YggT family protein